MTSNFTFSSDNTIEREKRRFSHNNSLCSKIIPITWLTDALADPQKSSSLRYSRSRLSKTEQTWCKNEMRHSSFSDCCCTYNVNTVNKSETHLFSGFVKIETSCHEFVSLFGALHEILPLESHTINNIAERLSLRVAETSRRRMK